MKADLDEQEIELIAQRVVEALKPFLAKSGKSETEETIFDVAGVAEYLKVDKTWVYKQVSSKAIPYSKVGKYTRFRRSDIDKWIKENSISCSIFEKN